MMKKTLLLLLAFFVSSLSANNKVLEYSEQNIPPSKDTYRNFLLSDLGLNPNQKYRLEIKANNFDCSLWCTGQFYSDVGQYNINYSRVDNRETSVGAIFEGGSLQLNEISFTKVIRGDQPIWINFRNGYNYNQSYRISSFDFTLRAFQTDSPLSDNGPIQTTGLTSFIQSNDSNLTLYYPEIQLLFDSYETHWKKTDLTKVFPVLNKTDYPSGAKVQYDSGYHPYYGSFIVSAHLTSSSSRIRIRIEHNGEYIKEKWVSLMYSQWTPKDKTLPHYYNNGGVSLSLSTLSVTFSSQTLSLPNKLTVNNQIIFPYPNTFNYRHAFSGEQQNNTTYSVPSSQQYTSYTETIEVQLIKDTMTIASKVVELHYVPDIRWEHSTNVVVNINQKETIGARVYFWDGLKPVTHWEIEPANEYVYTTSSHFIEIEILPHHSGNHFIIHPYFYAFSSTINVEVNIPPTFDIIASTTVVNYGESTRVNFLASDDNGDDYGITEFKAPLLVQLTSSSDSFSIELPEEGIIPDFDLLVTLTDNRGGVSTDNLLVITNYPPEVSLLTAMMIEEGKYIIPEGTDMDFSLNSTDDIAIAFDGFEFNGDIYYEKSIKLNTLGLGNGNYEITVFAEDIYGLRDEKTAIVKVLGLPEVRLSGYAHFLDNEVVGALSIDVEDDSFDTLTIRQLAGPIMSYNSSLRTHINGEAYQADDLQFEVQVKYPNFEPIFASTVVKVMDVWTDERVCNNQSTAQDTSVCASFSGENRQSCIARLNKQCRFYNQPPLEAIKCNIAKAMPQASYINENGNTIPNTQAFQDWGLSESQYVQKYNDINHIASRCLDSSYRGEIPPPRLNNNEIKGLDRYGCWDWQVEYVCVTNETNSCEDWDANQVGDFNNKPLGWKHKGDANIAVRGELYNNSALRDYATVFQSQYYANERWVNVCTRDSNGERNIDLENAFCERDGEGNIIDSSCTPAPLVQSVNAGAIPIDSNGSTLTQALIIPVDVSTPTKGYGVLSSRSTSVASWGITTISYTHNELTTGMRVVDDNPITIDDKIDGDNCSGEGECWSVQTHWRAYTGEEIQSCQASCTAPLESKVTGCTKFDYTKKPNKDWGSQYEYCVEPIMEVYCPIEAIRMDTLEIGENCGIAYSEITTSSITGEIIAQKSVVQCYSGQAQACVTNSSSPCELLSYEGTDLMNSGLYASQLQTWKCSLPQEVCVDEETKTVCGQGTETVEEKLPSSFNKALTAQGLADKTKTLNQQDVATGQIKLFNGELTSCKAKTEDYAVFMSGVASAYAVYQATNAYQSFSQVLADPTTHPMYGNDLSATDIMAEAGNGAGNSASALDLARSPEFFQQQKKCCSDYNTVIKKIEVMGVMSNAFNSAMGTSQQAQQVCTDEDVRVAIARESGKYEKIKGGGKTKIQGYYRGQRFEGAAYKIRSYTSDKINILGKEIKLEKAQDWCTFADPLARIVQQEGKKQLNELALTLASASSETRSYTQTIEDDKTWAILESNEDFLWLGSRENNDVYMAFCSGGENDAFCQTYPNDISNAHEGWKVYYLNGSIEETLAMTNRYIVKGGCENNNCTYSLNQIAENNHAVYETTYPLNTSSTAYFGLIEAVFKSHSSQTTLALKRLDQGNVNWTFYSLNPTLSEEVIDNDITITGECNSGHCQYFVQVEVSINAKADNDCSGFTPNEMTLIDFGKMDFGEYVNSLIANELREVDSINLLEKITGQDLRNTTIISVGNQVLSSNKQYIGNPDAIELTIKDNLPNGTLDNALVDWGDGTTSKLQVDTQLNIWIDLLDEWENELVKWNAEKVIFDDEKQAIVDRLTPLRMNYDYSCGDYGAVSSITQRQCLDLQKRITEEEALLKDYLCDGTLSNECGVKYRSVYMLWEYATQMVDDIRANKERYEEAFNRRIARGNRDIVIRKNYRPVNYSTMTITVILNNDVNESWKAIYRIKYDESKNPDEQHPELGGGVLRVRETKTDYNSPYQHRDPIQ